MNEFDEVNRVYLKEYVSLADDCSAFAKRCQAAYFLLYEAL